MQEMMQIHDESGDREYFTIIPNYVLNHSTVYDRDLYAQMKRIAGDRGTCWKSTDSLAAQCGVSRNRVKKSLKYLLDHEWIRLVGKREVQTAGGAQYVNEYAIVDLWKKNLEHYTKGGHEMTDLRGSRKKGGSRNDTKGGHEMTKGGSPKDHKEDHLNNNPNIYTSTNVEAQSAEEFGNSDINKIVDIFESYIGSGLPRKKLNRFAAQRLIKRHGVDKIAALAEFAISIQGEKYSPRVNNIMDLEEKLPALVNEKRRLDNQGGGLVVIS